jgi:catechol O-methyltransferase
VDIIDGEVQTVLKNYLLNAQIPAVDLAFVDHDKAFYLPDLNYLLDNSILRAGSVVVADNILVPGAPEYREYVNSSPRFRTVEYTSHLEYVKALKDIVAVSEVIY